MNALTNFRDKLQGLHMTKRINWKCEIQGSENLTHVWENIQNGDQTRPKTRQRVHPKIAKFTKFSLRLENNQNNQKLAQKLPNNLSLPLTIITIHFKRIYSLRDKQNYKLQEKAHNLAEYSLALKNSRKIWKLYLIPSHLFNQNTKHYGNSLCSGRGGQTLKSKADNFVRRTHSNSKSKKNLKINNRNDKAPIYKLNSSYRKWQHSPVKTPGNFKHAKS